MEFKATIKNTPPSFKGQRIFPSFRENKTFNSISSTTSQPSNSQEHLTATTPVQSIGNQSIQFQKGTLRSSMATVGKNTPDQSINKK